MTTTRIVTTFLIISDTHNFQFDDALGAFRLPLPKVDVVLHCGDLTHCGGASSYKKALKMLGGIDAEKKLVIAGNHDLDLDGPHWIANLVDDDEPEEHDEAIAVMMGPLAEEAGVTYLQEGSYTFSLSNGAKFTIYASPYQPEFNNWAFPYERNQDRFNLPTEVAEGTTSIATNPVPNFPEVDIMMTHGPPKGVLDGDKLGCNNLLRAAGRARPLLYCFGHIHEGYGAQMVTWKEGDGKEGAVIEAEKAITRRNTFPQPDKQDMEFGKQTLMVNAAIMDDNNKAVHVPWLIELELKSGNKVKSLEHDGGDNLSAC